MRLGFCNEISRQTLICSACHRERFIVPENPKETDLALCDCGSVVGPIGSLQALIRDEGHTAVNVFRVQY